MSNSLTLEKVRQSKALLKLLNFRIKDIILDLSLEGGAREMFFVLELKYVKDSLRATNKQRNDLSCGRKTSK